MKLNKIAFAALAVASTGAFAATTPLCVTNPTGTSDQAAKDLIAKCSPEVTFFAVGGTAMRDAYKNVMLTMFDTDQPLVYVKVSKVAATEALFLDSSKENKDQFAMYGIGKSTLADSLKGKRIAVIVNTANGTMAGVNMVLTGGKSGSTIGTTPGNEFNSTIALQTAANMKAASPYAPAGMSELTTYTLPNSTVVKSFVLPAGVGIADLKSGWGVDKNKVPNIAFADIRPTDAIPGQLVGKWDTTKFPWTTLAMQGFQVVVNKKMYNALLARDKAAGRIASDCADADATNLNATALKCQPTVFSTEMASLMKGKVPASFGITDAAADKLVTLHRRVDSSGTQSAAQIFFTKVGTMGVKNAPFFDAVVGAATADGLPVDGTTANYKVKVWSSSDSLVDAIKGDASGYSIGYVSNDKGSYTTVGDNRLSVKIDGMSPNFDGSTVDSYAKATLSKGYPFQFEFGAVALQADKPAQAAIAALFKAGLSDTANNLKGVAYNTGTNASPYSRKGNNLGALSE